MSDSSRSAFDLNADFFTLFSLAQDYWLDLSALKAEYLALQQQYHPDRYAKESESEQREAVQRTAYVNQAYETLKSPLKRAIYLLELKGKTFDLDSQTHTDTSFLMSQLELRERLESVGDADDPFSELDHLLSRAEIDCQSYQQEFVAKYSDESWNAAIEAVHKMMFASKLLEEISLKEELLEN